MKSLPRKTHRIPLFGSLLLIVGTSLPLSQPLKADEPVNVSDVQECRAIRSKSERLICYDTVVDGGIFNEQQVKQAQRENFGSRGIAAKKVSEESVDENDSLEKLTVTIVRIQKDASGLRYFQTSDGQVWKQRNRDNWGSEVPFEAEIKSGMLGSFFLVLNGNKSTRVKRVK